MQDRYAGDLGDYLKFGLLRWLAPPGAPASPRLGVVWYRTADETHNPDGKHITYLDPGHWSSGHFRDLDRDLYDRLAHAIYTERSVARLAAAGLLDAGTCFFGDPLDLAALTVSPWATELRVYWS